MNCPYCGTANSNGTRFCVGCGANIEGAPHEAPKPPVQTYQASYAPPPPAYQSVPAINPLTQPMRTGEFFWMMFVFAIPLVGFICSLVWAFGGNVNLNRKNLSRAVLIWMLVSIILTIVVSIILALLGASLADAFSSYTYY
ncbi:MAG TPA: zinc ribbon domain-containing protein [Clostridia bacterium]|nr:zinc ribbon domain-containing protein [Clostridia bacterium]